MEIPPCPDLKITEQASNRYVVSNSEMNNDAIGLSNKAYNDYRI